MNVHTVCPVTGRARVVVIDGARVIGHACRAERLATLLTKYPLAVVFGTRAALANVGMVLP